MAGTSIGSCRYYNSRCSLPSAWEARATLRSDTLAMSYLKVEGCRVRYVGPGEEDSQAACVRANLPVPGDCPLYYFEVRVVDRGQDGYIGVGFCTSEVRLSRLPGWDVHSYGYHGDDGHAFASQGVGRPYGPTYGTGDVIGALYDKVERTISYFKNGRPLGVAFREVQEASPLYPCVGMRTKGEDLLANFGSGGEPFRADFQALQSDLQASVLASVRAAPLPLLSSGGTALLPQLMYDYLVHQRYGRTAALLARDLLRPSASSAPAATAGSAPASTSGACMPLAGKGKSSSVLQQERKKQQGQEEQPRQQHPAEQEEELLADIAVRQQSYELVASGRIDEALQLLRDTYPPELLSERPSLDFRLRLQKFVQLVAAAHCAAGGAAGGAAAGQAGAAGGTAGGTAAEAAEAATREAAVGGSCCSGKGRDREAAEEGHERPGTPMDTDDAGLEQRREEATGRPAAAVGPPPTTREILEYGSTELMPICRTAADRDLLTDALSLLAFHDPAASPAGYLLRPAHRTQLAEELNCALLGCRGRPPAAPLEQLYRQAVVLLGELRGRDEPKVCALPEARALILEPLQQGNPSSAAAAAAAGDAGAGAGAGTGVAAAGGGEDCGVQGMAL